MAIFSKQLRIDWYHYQSVEEEGQEISTICLILPWCIFIHLNELRDSINIIRMQQKLYFNSLFLISGKQEYKIGPKKTSPKAITQNDQCR